jgi:hypothetical protein
MDRLRWAIAPDPRRSMALLLSAVAVFSVLGGVASLVELPRIIAGALMLLMVIVWLIGLCGMVGYLRWFLVSGSNDPGSSR